MQQTQEEHIEIDEIGHRGVVAKGVEYVSGQMNGSVSDQSSLKCVDDSFKAMCRYFDDEGPRKIFCRVGRQRGCAHIPQRSLSTSLISRCQCTATMNAFRKPLCRLPEYFLHQHEQAALF